MSGSSILTVGGAFDGHSGVLSIPSSLPTAVNSLLQTYLDGVTGSITGGTASFMNYNAVTGTSVSVGGSGTNFYEEITNIDSVGASTGGSVSSVVGVTAGVTDLVVQVPGYVSVSGVSTTDFALFGAASNVSYSVSGGAGSIIAAGGDDSISIGGSGAIYTVTSAGNDTVNFNGTNALGVIDASGNATTRVYVGGSDVVTVEASDSAQASVVFLANAGGNLDFINNSGDAQTVFSGAYTTAGGGSIYAVNAVTAYGGGGGGFFVGGRGGYNLLQGGTGDVTLVGGGANDTLMSGTGTQNFLYSGVGAETLQGGTGSGSNVFYVGLENVGIGMTSAVGDVVSSNGSGTQDFILGNLTATTLTGSTVTGASNVYDVFGAVSASGGVDTLGGSSFTITDFGANSTIFLLDESYGFGSNAPTVETMQSALGGGGTTILLSDGTQISLKGVSTSQVSVTGGGHVINLT